MLTVVDESGNVLYKPETDEAHNAAVARLFKTLATAFDPDNVRFLTTKPLSNILIYTINDKFFRFIA